MRSFAEDHRRGVGSYVAGDARREVNLGVGRGEIELLSAHHERVGRGEGERGLAEWSGIDSGHEVVHYRVAHEDDLEHMGNGDGGLGTEFDDQLVECTAYGVGENSVPARVHHHVRHPAHQVVAIADLGVHPPSRGEHLTGGQVAKMAGDGCAADIDRHSTGPIDEAWPSGDHGIGADGHCGGTRSTFERLVNLLQGLEFEVGDRATVLGEEFVDHQVAHRGCVTEVAGG